MLRRVLAATAVPVLVGACALWGRYLEDNGARLLLQAPPFSARADVRIGGATALAALVALLVVLQGHEVARRLPWQALPWLTSAVAAAWAVSLALVDGRRGLTYPLSTPDEYPHDLSRVHDLTGFLSHFVAGINTYGAPGAWTTHVAGHPPGLLLVLAGMREVGLSGILPAALLCIAVGSSASAAVLITARRLAGEDAARAAAPFLALLPAAVWVAVSADAFFLGVSAWGIALLAGSGLVRAAVGGVVMGAALMLSYGLLLLGVLAATVLLLHRRVASVLVAAAAAAAVLVVFALLGFNWLDGLSETLIRYRAGAGGFRPYGYFLVADVALLAVAVGPAAVAGLTAWHRRDPLGWLVGAALVGLLIADLSGNSKAEVERIWLPFMPWVALFAARLDRPRTWLGLQALTGLGLQTALLSKW